MRLCIASSRWEAIGTQCREWAAANLPEGVTLTYSPDDCDVFISVLYGHLVSEEFIAKRRCFNFHPGILPQYRGAGAFSWSILNGDKECGITLHELDVDIDTGPIIAIGTFAIEPWDTAESLFGKGMAKLFEMFQANFHAILKGDYEAKPQEQSKARTYYRKDLKAAQDLTRAVRAFSFGGKEPAYYLDSKGQRVELRW
jgi:methionyl-tRNA formyltransferase